MDTHYFEVSVLNLNPDFRERLYRLAGGWQNVFTYGLPSGKLVLEVPAQVADSIRRLLMDWEIVIIKDSSEFSLKESGTQVL